MQQGRLTAQAHTAHEANVDDILVAEADGAEVDCVLGRHREWVLPQ